MPVAPRPSGERGPDAGPDAVAAHARLLRSHVEVSRIRPLTVVVDVRGADESTVRAVLGTDASAGAGAAAVPSAPPIELVVVRTGATADLRDLQSVVLEHGADVGLVLDDAARRCVVVDERGVPVGPSTVAVLVTLSEVARERAAGRTPTVVIGALTSRAVDDLATAAGARTVRAGVGHAIVEAERARLDALVGVGHDGGFAFRDVASADAALVAALHVLAALGGQPHALSDLTELYEPYAASGAIDLDVPDADAALARVTRAYVADRGAGTVEADEHDGLTVSHWAEAPRWWFTLRAGPVAGDLRLVVEAADEDIMDKVRDDVIALARNDGETSR